MGLYNFDKDRYLQEINCYCILHDYLANLNGSSTTLHVTALITYLFLKNGGYVINTL